MSDLVSIQVEWQGYALQVKKNSPPARLSRAGWRLLQRKKNGCMIAEKWRHPTNGEVYSRGIALCIQFPPKP